MRVLKVPSKFNLDKFRVILNARIPQKRKQLENRQKKSNKPQTPPATKVAKTKERTKANPKLAKHGQTNCHIQRRERDGEHDENDVMSESERDELRERKVVGKVDWHPWRNSSAIDKAATPTTLNVNVYSPSVFIFELDFLFCCI